MRGVGERCPNAPLPLQYHKLGRIHFLDPEDRSQFVRACRYCSRVMTYTVSVSKRGKVVVNHPSGEDD